MFPISNSYNKSAEHSGEVTPTVQQGWPNMLGLLVSKTRGVRTNKIMANGRIFMYSEEDKDKE